MPSRSWMLCFTYSIVSSGSTSSVLVLPVSVVAKIVMPTPVVLSAAAVADRGWRSAVALLSGARADLVLLCLGDHRPNRRDVCRDGGDAVGLGGRTAAVVREKIGRDLIPASAS